MGPACGCENAPPHENEATVSADKLREEYKDKVEMKKEPPTNLIDPNKLIDTNPPPQPTVPPVSQDKLKEMETQFMKEKEEVVLPNEKTKVCLL